MLSGMFFPTIGLYSNSVPLLVGIMLFCSFLDVKINFGRILRKELFISFFLSAVVMPVLGYYVISIQLSIPYRIGILLVSCAPTGISPLLLAKYIRDTDYDLVVSNFLFLTFAALLYIPFVLGIILKQTIEVSIQAIIGQTFALLLVPYAASRLVIHLESVLGSLFKTLANATLFASLFSIIAISIGVAWGQLNATYELLWISLPVLEVYLVHALLGFFAGWLVGGRSVRNTLTFICSSRNVQLVLGIGALNFSSATLLPIVIAILFHHVTNAFWLWIFRKR